MGGGGGGNLGVILVRVCEPVFQNLPPFIYLAFKKTDPFIYLIIQNVDQFIYCPLIFVPIFCWLLDKYHSQYSCNTKRISSLEKSLSEKYVHIPGCQKNGAFHIGIQKNWAIHILFVEKRGLIIYLAVLKRGLFGMHIRTMPYIGIYRKLPPPSPTLPPITKIGRPYQI